MSVARKITIGISIIVFFLLQVSVFSHLHLGGIVPNLMILLVSVYGFIHGERYGIVIGFFCGLLIDLFYGDFIGLNALICTFLGYLNGQFYGMFFAEDIRLPLWLILGSDMTYGVTVYILRFLLRGKLDFWYYLSRVILPEMLYTILAGILIYPLILRIYKAFEEARDRSDIGRA